MKQLLIFATLLALLATPLLAANAPSVEGERARRHARYLYYVKALFAEKRAIYMQFGYPPHRIRINAQGQVREKWTYPELNVEFTFDMDGNITMVRRLHI